MNNQNNDNITNNNINKNNLRLISYLGIGILALIVFRFVILCLIDIIKNENTEYGIFAHFFGFGMMMIVFIYYAISVSISIVIDKTKGKCIIKDIIVLIYYLLPIVFILFRKIFNL